MKNPNFDIWLERASHLVAVGLSLIAAFLLRFDFAAPPGIIQIMKEALLIAVLVKLPIFDLIGFYRTLRRFVSIPDLYLVFLGNLAGSVLFIVVSVFWIGPSMPRSVMIMDAVLCFVATALVRFSVRICNEAFRERSAQQRMGILIYGAGAAGAELVREIHSNPCTQYEVMGFLDDDPSKQACADPGRFRSRIGAAGAFSGARVESGQAGSRGNHYRHALSYWASDARVARQLPGCADPVQDRSGNR